MSILSGTESAESIGLLPAKRQVVRNFARELRKVGYAELDRYRIREDFHGLYSDIVQELKTRPDKAADFYELSEVLDEIAALAAPDAAYACGWRAKKAGTEFHLGFMAFMRGVISTIEISGLSEKRDRLFQGLCETLGDARSLMTEFVELHGKVNIEQSQIDRFFKLGYSDSDFPLVCQRETEEMTNEIMKEQ
jgi:hypothetical protein